MIKLSASILAADLGNLEKEILAVDPFVDEYHVDVMDGHFLNNIAGGLDFVMYFFYPIIAGADVLVSSSCIFNPECREDFLKGLEIIRKFY